jgi:hypothetical protein
MLFGCSQVANRACNDCPTEEPNRIIHIAFVKKGTTINTALALEPQLLQAEKACNAVIFRNTNATYDGGASSTGKGAGKQPTRILSKLHTIVATDFDITGQVEFWNDFQESSIGYFPVYFTSNKGWVVDSGVSLTVDAKTPITDDINTFIEGNITITWSYKKTAIPFNATPDLLELCQALFEREDLLDWENIGGSTATFNGDIITVTQSVAFDVALDTGEDLYSATTTATLPVGVTLGVLGQSITLSGTTAVLQSGLSIPVIAENACGMQGEVDITLIVEA